MSTFFTTVEPTFVVLLYSSLAAGMAVFGIAPLLLRHELPIRWIGWSNALAAGLMLGAAYVLMIAAIEVGVAQGAAGAALGIGFIHFTHVASGTDELDLNRLEETSPVYGYQVLLLNSLHSAPEGVAIGAAMAVSVPFGIFVALAIAVHNVPEATALSAVLRGRGVRLGEAAGLSVTANISQILLAVTTFAVVSAAPGALPWALGFAVGALIYLVTSDLLPECYRQTGPTSIALVTIAAMGMVVLLRGLSP